MRFTKPLSALDKNTVAIAGGKASSLGEMTKAGIPVPPGFVVLSNAFNHFIEKTGINVEIASLLNSVDVKKMHNVENASEKIHVLILNAEVPQEIIKEINDTFSKLNASSVAVRSSATAEDSSSAAWAGQLETYLNTKQDNLQENIKKCWASLFTPRAIFYRFKKNLNKKNISVAVVIQKMVSSDVSGIAFSVHPVTQDKNQMIIEAGYGLGEAIVSGQITPDSYVVEKKPRRIIDKNVQTQAKGLYRSEHGGNEWIDIPKEQGEKQVLSDEHILELSNTIIRIEDHYNFPCDIEWALEKGMFYVLQSRPITTLTSTANIQKKEYKFMWGQKQSAMITEAMLSQILIALNENGQPTDSKVRETLFVLSDGIFSHYMPDESIRDLEKNSERYSSSKYSQTLFSHIDRHIKDFFAFCNKIKNAQLHKLSNLELKDIFTKYQNFITKTFYYFATSTPSGTAFLVNEIKKILNIKFKDASVVEDYFIALSTPTEFDETMRERIDFLNIAEKKQFSNEELENYARKYPALFFNTYNKDVVMDFLRTRLEQQRGAKFTAKEEIRKMKTNLSKVAEEHQKIHQEFHNEKLKNYAFILQQAGLGRYCLKHVWSGGEYVCLDLIHKLQKRVGVDFDDFIKTYMFSDIIRFLDSEEVLSSEEVEDRKKCIILHYYDAKIHRYIGDEAVAYRDTRIPLQDDALFNVKNIRGDIANKGIIRGRARIVLVEDLKQFVKDSDSFRRDEILVTTMTSPIMIPIIEKAGAIITDEGGICSHAAISAREFKIPCVVGTHDASSIIKTGDLVEVDADNGQVKILERVKTLNGD